MSGVLKTGSSGKLKIKKKRKRSFHKILFSKYKKINKKANYKKNY